ncbi:MAG: hypothetical protein AB7P69_12980 [Candidatus Binatia bacterium]
MLASITVPGPHGVSFALVAALLFGASTPLAKVLLGTVDPMLLAGLLYLGSGSGCARVVVDARLAERARIPRGWV